MRNAQITLQCEYKVLVKYTVALFTCVIYVYIFVEFIEVDLSMLPSVTPPITCNP